MSKSSHRRDDKPPRSKLPSKQKCSSRKSKDVVDSPKVFGNFNTDGISQEELEYWSQIAPEGQKLEDIEKTPAKQHAVHDIATGITHVSN